MKLLFLLMASVLMSHVYALELDRIGSRENYPEWVYASYQEASQDTAHELDQFKKTLFAVLPGMAVNFVRSLICGRMIENVSKAPVWEKKYISVNKHDIAKFGLDLFSCAAVESANGKTLGQACGSGLNQACSMVMQNRLERALALCMTNPKRNNSYDRWAPSVAASAIMFASRSYVFPVVKAQSLALLKTILAKK